MRKRKKLMAWTVVICITTFLFTSKTMAQSGQIQGSSSTSGDLFQEKYDFGVGSLDNPEARVQIFNGIHQEGGNAGKRAFLISGRIQGITGWITSPVVPGQFQLPPQPQWSFPTPYTYFTVNNQGNVGVNVLNPLTKLHLNNGIFTISDGKEDFTNGTLKEITSNWQIHGTKNSFAIKDQLAEKYRFWIRKDNGNVGIGNSAPDEKLEVEGNTLVNGFVQSQTSTGYIKIFSANASYAHFLTDVSKFYFNKSIHVDGGISSFSTNDLELQTGGYTRMIVKYNGKVDIGNNIIAGAHTDYKLAVEGKIVSKKVVVTLDNWADHVFGENYKLKSLAEVENFITKNKHLPEVPSEKEVLEEGIELGEMNKLLLLKVEELTLYMIQMQKEIDNLKNAE